MALHLTWWSIAGIWLKTSRCLGYCIFWRLLRKALKLPWNLPTMPGLQKRATKIFQRIHTQHFAESYALSHHQQMQAAWAQNKCCSVPCWSWLQGLAAWSRAAGCTIPRALKKITKYWIPYAFFTKAVRKAAFFKDFYKGCVGNSLK